MVVDGFVLKVACSNVVVCFSVVGVVGTRVVGICGFVDSAAGIRVVADSCAVGVVIVVVES